MKKSASSGGVSLTALPRTSAVTLIDLGIDATVPAQGPSLERLSDLTSVSVLVREARKVVGFCVGVMVQQEMATRIGVLSACGRASSCLACPAAQLRPSFWRGFENKV
ncbi:hypothetical protein ColLi_13161 [Colletotrichum liriopes]|uniref:Uncharacterized protein n=1 Tax=Colletotrichum liriopes TaxID=708192 RepID=A0AA37H2D9_9PEZI|nr:hypothetical protein ColLi_13161 [Colletotrichum liriopes]